MKRPKTAIDKAMELSPLKTAVLLNDHVCFRLADECCRLTDSICGIPGDWS